MEYVCLVNVNNFYMKGKGQVASVNAMIQKEQRYSSTHS
jgi:hypothetical protein